MNGEDQYLWMRLGCQPGFVTIHAPPLCGHRQHAAQVSSNVQLSAVGVQYLVSQELANLFPGGRRYRRIRLEIITAALRSASFACLAAGQMRLAWSLYKTGFAWQLARQRWRYVVGFPWLMLLRMAKSLAVTLFSSKRDAARTTDRECSGCASNG